jgi:hypothetical protein
MKLTRRDLSQGRGLPSASLAQRPGALALAR